MSQINNKKLAQGTAFALIFSFIFLALESSANTLRVVEGNNSIETYARGLLKLALSKLPEQYEVKETIASNSEERMVSMVMDNQLEVVWYATTNDLEERMQPIRIPIYRGLLGYRVLMIKKGTQHKFDGIKTKEDLKRVSLGQGCSGQVNLATG